MPSATHFTSMFLNGDAYRHDFYEGLIDAMNRHLWAVRFSSHGGTSAQAPKGKEADAPLGRPNVFGRYSDRCSYWVERNRMVRVEGI